MKKKDVANPTYLVVHIRKIKFPPGNVFISSTLDGENESIVHVEMSFFFGRLGSPTSLEFKSTE
jgi:hypothetical protein